MTLVTASRAHPAATIPPGPHPAASQPATTAASTTRTAATLPTAYECRWTDDPITIDGKADEPAWAHAQVVTDFRIPGPVGGKPQTATKARLLWDREYLYYFAEMEDADLYADIKEHNGAIWTNDVFELFFKPAEDKPGYYEFEVSPANTRMELFLPARDAGGWLKFKDQTSIDMKTAVVLHGTLNQRQDKDQGWDVEGRIRWRDFAMTGGRPEIGEQWKFALCRVDYVSGSEKPELSSIAPLTRPDYHHYEDYATVRFVGPDGKSGSKAFGIEHRVPWTRSRVVGFPDPPLPYRVAKAFPKLKVFQPVYLAEEPGTDNLLAVQHLGSWAGPGKVIRFRNDADIDSAETLLENDRLIYGLTFHPRFRENGYVYLISNGPVDAENKQNRISRFTIDRQPPYRLDPKSEMVILEWDSNGHNGGDLAFGPDGYLYHAAGDGTSDSDVNLRGQEMSHLTCKMLRIDVDHPSDGKNYFVPPDNPFVGQPGIAPETWAYGFRNPWRITFDARTGDLWVGQNGQDLWEQAYVVHKGENYGWSVNEGSHPFQPTRQRGPTPIVMPTIEHPHSEMRSLTGGVVYYGDKFPELNGVYVYGDFGTGRIFGARYERGKVTWHKELARTRAPDRRLSRRQARRPVRPRRRRRGMEARAGSCRGGTGHPISDEAERDGPFHRHQDQHPRPGADPLLRQRVTLVGRRGQGAVHRAAR